MQATGWSDCTATSSLEKMVCISRQRSLLWKPSRCRRAGQVPRTAKADVHSWRAWKITEAYQESGKWLSRVARTLGIWYIVQLQQCDRSKGKQRNSNLDKRKLAVQQQLDILLYWLLFVGCWACLTLFLHCLFWVRYSMSASLFLSISSSRSCTPSGVLKVESRYGIDNCKRFLINWLRQYDDDDDEVLCPLG